MFEILGVVALAAVAVMYVVRTGPKAANGAYMLNGTRALIVAALIIVPFIFAVISMLGGASEKKTAKTDFSGPHGWERMLCTDNGVLDKVCYEEKLRNTIAETRDYNRLQEQRCTDAYYNVDYRCVAENAAVESAVRQAE